MSLAKLLRMNHAASETTDDEQEQEAATAENASPEDESEKDTQAENEDVSDDDGEDKKVKSSVTNHKSYQAGYSAGLEAARVRTHAIVNSKESASNPGLALSLACDKPFADLSAEQCVALLKKSATADNSSTFEKRMKRIKNPNTGTGARATDDKPQNKLAQVALRRAGK